MEAGLASIGIKIESVVIIMRDSIYTIPVNEVFEPKCGCPICSMRDTLEERCLEYIMGAAMMEPDVRIETNKKGFCRMHYGMLLKQKNRLSLALMLESHLTEILEKGMKPPEISGGGRFGKKKFGRKTGTLFYMRTNRVGFGDDVRYYYEAVCILRGISEAIL